MNAAEFAEDVGSGAEEEVVGISEEDLGAAGFEGLGELSFDRGLRADGHEDGSGDFVVERAEGGGAGAGAGGLGVEAEVEAG